MTRRKANLGLFFLIGALLWACTASGPAFTPAPMPGGDHGLIYIYRPSTFFESGNPEIPVAYVDGRRIARLRIGGYLWVPVSAGTHTVTVREPVLGVPAFQIGEVRVDVEPQTGYFVRFSKEFGEVIPYGGSAVVVPHSALVRVAPEFGRREIRETKGMF